MYTHAFLKCALSSPYQSMSVVSSHALQVATVLCIEMKQCIPCLQETTELHGIALSAGHKLLEEEATIAAQAAAKKAKKLRQKAKKQQHQQVETATEAEADDTEDEGQQPTQPQVPTSARLDHLDSDVHLADQKAPFNTQDGMGVDRPQAAISTAQRTGAKATKSDANSGSSPGCIADALTSKPPDIAQQCTCLPDEDVRQSPSEQPDAAGSSSQASDDLLQQDLSGSATFLQLLFCCPLTKVGGQLLSIVF